MKSKTPFTIGVNTLSLELFNNLDHTDKDKVLILLENEFIYMVNCLTCKYYDNGFIYSVNLIKGIKERGK